MSDDAIPSDVFEARWRAGEGRPQSGRVAALVVRVGGGEHATPSRVALSPLGGMEGDRWSAGPRLPEAQITLLSLRVAESLVAGEIARLHVPGDNVVVDRDLDAALLPVGTRFALGTALLEISPKPHRGCAKFRARLGDGALRFVADRRHEGRRLRGVYARVIEPGSTAIGDVFTLVP